MTALFIAGTIPLILAGGLHAVYALVDLVRPTYFAPIERSVKPAMEGTGIGLRRGTPAGEMGRPSVWSVWIGVHIGFGVGILMFGALCLLLAVHDSALLEEIALLRPLALAFSAVYLVLSLRFFFHVPALITGVSTACFTLAMVLPA